jgi:PAS domain S-box-containing protein
LPVPIRGDHQPNASESGLLRGRLEELRALIPEIPAWPPSDDGTEAMALSLAELLERKQRHLIEENVRLVALREMTEDLLREPDEERVLRTISLYLRHAYGLAEVLVLSRDEGGGLRGYRARPGGAALCEPVRWSGDTLRGTVWEKALAGETVWVEEPFTPSPGTPAPLPVILPLQAGSEPSIPRPEEKGRDKNAMGLLALRPDPETGAGNDPLQVEQLAFQAATILESVRHHQRIATERRFRECLLEAMEDGLIAVDGVGNLSAANRAALAMLGADKETLLGRPLEVLSDRSAQLVALCRAGLEGHTRITQQEAEVTGGEERFPVSVSVVPLGDGGDDGRGIVATFSDLRVLRAMEQEVRRLDRLAALGRFASAVAHEIRNPLAAIGAGVEFLSSSVPADRRDDVGFIRAEVRRLDRIVCDLLEPARMQPLCCDCVAVHELVQRACQTAEPQARERGVEFALRPPAEEAFRTAIVEVDLDRMLQVLVNVVRNAIEASPSGHAVEIGWHAERGEKELVTRIWTQDHGSGIPPEHLAHVFEPFYSTKPTGTGLGLYVSHGVVERHGGSMQVESHAAGGTRVTISLPGRVN